MSGLKDEKLIKKQTYMKSDAISILETFEYFCQISSKSVLNISSYTVSKLGRFLRHSVYTLPTTSTSNRQRQKNTYLVKDLLNDLFKTA